MADLFISYSSRDRAFIVPLVEYLERFGYAVWWDRHIDAGSTFDKDIEDALDAAKCVIVVWSRNSVRSNWVRAEANEGLTRGILVPVLIDETRPPLIFRSLQNLDYRLGNEQDLANLVAAIQKAAPSIRQSPEQVPARGEREDARVPAPVPIIERRDWSVPPFVGRENLLASLDDALAMAGRGSGQVVMLSGEPGIGKSRTSQEFGERARQRGVVVYAAWCDESLYSPPFWPLTRLLRNIVEQLNPPLQREELGHGGAVLSGILPELREMFPDIGTVPEYSPEHLNFETAQALFNLLRRLGERRPLLILFDDLHCADDQTLTVLLMLAREIGRSSVMFLGNFRDTEIAADHKLSEGLADLSRVGHYRRHDLEGLSREEVIRFMMESVDGNKELADTVIEKTDGNPLFVTEIGRAINADGGGGGVRPAGHLVVPRSLQDLVLNRLRDVSLDCRQFLNISSVLGRTLRPEIVCEVGGIELQTGNSAIAEASQSGILDHGPSGRLRFAHIILRDALYEDLSPSDRIDWHRAAAEYYASRTGNSDGLASHCETIAHHFQEAGIVDSALDYWEQAAAIARSQSAYADAAVRFKQALALLADSGLGSRARVEREIRLRLGLGGALITLEGAGSTDAVPEFRRALELCNLYPDSPSLFFAVNGVWTYHAMHCNSEAVPLVARQRELADQLNSQTAHVLASSAEGTTRFFEGDFNVALAHLERATGLWLEMLQRRVSQGKAGPSLSHTMLSPLYNAWCLALVGRADEGLELAKHTLAQALDLGTHSHVQALSYISTIYETTGNYPRLLDVSRQIIEIAEENGYVSWLAIARCTLGKAIARLEDPAAGLAEAEAGREAYRALGGFLCLTWRQLHLAEMLRLNGRLREAISMVDQTLAASTDRFEHFADPELYRVRGECALELGEPEGLDWLHRAQRMANSRGARLFELRASTSILEHASDSDVAQRLETLGAEIAGGIGETDRERVNRALAGL